MTAPATAPAVGPTLDRAAGELRAVSSTPRLDAELLLASVLDVGRAHLFARPERGLSAAAAVAFEALLTRRRQGEPIAYILGQAEFLGLPLQVTPAVLIPRPETEHLVERALARLPQGGSLLDAGTGSGAIALAIARDRPASRIDGVDRDPAAILVAQRNRDRLGLPNLWLFVADWMDGLGDTGYGVIAANPPYVERDAPEWASGALAYEPRCALDGGPDGLDAIRALAAGAGARLAPGGWLILEHGARQGAAVRELLTAHGLEAVTTTPDLAGHERVTEGRQP